MTFRWQTPMGAADTPLADPTDLSTFETKAFEQLLLTRHQARHGWPRSGPTLLIAALMSSPDPAYKTVF